MVSTQESTNTKSDQYPQKQPSEGCERPPSAAINQRSSSLHPPFAAVRYSTMSACFCLVIFSSGKTLLAKAVANQTSATFLRVVGSELIQKYLGDGPKLVRELFRVAEEHAPSIVFIDEIDAIGTKR